MTSTKKDVIQNLVDSGSVVRLYVDPRHESVAVPEHLKAQEWLCLDIGIPSALAKPIRDLVIDEWGVHGTLSFGGWPFYCSVSYDAIHGVRHLATDALVSWAAALRGEAPPTTRPAPTVPAAGAKVVNLAAWRQARGR